MVTIVPSNFWYLSVIVFDPLSEKYEGWKKLERKWKPYWYSIHPMYYAYDIDPGVSQMSVVTFKDLHSIGPKYLKGQHIWIYLSC